MKTKNINIETFHKWALKDKDLNMQKGHTPAVNKMFEIINNNTTLMESSFKFLDLGCGNGWVVKEVSKNSFCKKAVGIDGAKAMIDKANKTLSNNQEFIHADIESSIINDSFDIIFSMETFYYFKNPSSIVKKIYNDYLNDKGILIIGIDHYLENKESLNWDKEYNLYTNTLSKDEWLNIFKNEHFSNIKLEVFNKKDDWGGTLIIFAQKL